MTGGQHMVAILGIPTGQHGVMSTPMLDNIWYGGRHGDYTKIHNIACVPHIRETPQVSLDSGS